MKKAMLIHKILASLAGTASLAIGILRFFIGSLEKAIPVQDGVIHIVTGLIFLAGAWVARGRYVRITNLCLGIFYVLFGLIEFNWPHLILGLVFLLIGLTLKIK
jgi:hypothetical protein